MSKNEPIFSARDFAGSTELIDHISWEDAAAVANHKINQLLGPVVFGLNKGDGWVFTTDFQKSPTDTHTARLFNVQEIKPKECKHMPKVEMDEFFIWVKRKQDDHFICENCGKKLKATWSADD